MGILDMALGALGFGRLFGGSSLSNTQADPRLQQSSQAYQEAQAAASQRAQSIEQYPDSYAMGVDPSYEESMGLRQTDQPQWYTTRATTRTSFDYPLNWDDYYAAMGYYTPQPKPTPEIEVKTAAVGLRQIEV